MAVLDSSYSETGSAVILQTGDTYILPKENYLVSTLSSGLRVVSNDVFDITIEGAVRGVATAFKAAVAITNVEFATIAIGSSGLASGGWGLSINAPANITNAGSIIGFRDYGIYCDSFDDVMISNSGLISGEGAAIKYIETGGTHTIINSGIIRGPTAVDAVSAVANITNTGMMEGGIDLGSGDDVVHSEFGVINGTVTLGEGQNQFYGGRSNDNVTAGSGSDILDGNKGNDTLAGGAGGDIYYVDSQNDVIIEDALGGEDGVYASTSFTLPETAEVENIVGILGSGDISLTGNAVCANHITGNDGNNLISSSVADGFTDILRGELGNDTYDLGGEALDTVTDTSGNDTILTYLSRDLSNYSGVENLTLYDTFKANLVGNDAANVLTGNINRNNLYGGGGADLLIGGVGKDLLTGAKGSDRFDFNTLDDSGSTGNQRDTISDFNSGQDKIDLSDIDAISGGLDDDFFLDARGAGSSNVGKGHIGYFWIDKSGTFNDLTILRMNTDPDADVEMTIALQGLHKLKATDFAH